MKQMLTRAGYIVLGALALLAVGLAILEDPGQGGPAPDGAAAQAAFCAAIEEARSTQRPAEAMPTRLLAALGAGGDGAPQPAGAAPAVFAAWTATIADIRTGPPGVFLTVTLPCDADLRSAPGTAIAADSPAADHLAGLAAGDAIEVTGAFLPPRPVSLERGFPVEEMSQTGPDALARPEFAAVFTLVSDPGVTTAAAAARAIEAARADVLRIAEAAAAR